MQIIVSHFTKNTKTSVLYHMKNNLRLTLTLILNVRVEDNIIQFKARLFYKTKQRFMRMFSTKKSR